MKIRAVILGILAIALYLCGCSAIQTASSQYNPATAQPSPKPDQIITDIPQIIAALNQLAEKSMNQYHQKGWWHRIDTVISEEGDLHSINHEEWLQLPENQSECMIRMDIAKDPDKGEIILWQIQTAEGYLGNIITLRNGESKVIQVDLASCRMTTATTQAGFFAQALAGAPIGKDSKQKLEFARAWYEKRGSSQVFVVEAGFQTVFEKLTHVTEQYVFDLESGMAIDHIYGMQWQDDSQMGQVETQSYYELWEEMPKEVAEQYQQGLKELKSYAEGLSNDNQAPVDEVPTAQPIDLESMLKPYTEENPLTDETWVMVVIQEVVRRRTAWSG